MYVLVLLSFTPSDLLRLRIISVWKIMGGMVTFGSCALFLLASLQFPPRPWGLCNSHISSVTDTLYPRRYYHARNTPVKTITRFEAWPVLRS
ncbi:hypothetical protein CONLIGDRAFT_7705 [Coniochaeta ligniaria NRRL 30616]|uniref:Uncharacterized protein n=1 Tax=Coniochaeta ligniaria NRRL 30616 TaxID=1408157 RepID=A0A1J7J3Z2_9PEZI|nr:hypothetical protein CONLIGDRAFT_7705 [Coniochaeta ligniaria NRRL 30616]